MTNATAPISSAPQLGAAPSNGPVTVIVLTWNGLDYTKRCLESLRNTSHPQCQFQVADNGSSDGTPEYLRSLTSITTFANGTNLGFARGNNEAIARSDPGSDIVLLNNDTEILQPDWLERLQATRFNDPPIGLVGCGL